MTTEILNNGVVIHQYRDAFRFGTDAVLLAWFAAQKKTKRAYDLCSGCGVVPLLLSSYQPRVRVTGVEIDERVALLAKQSIADSGRTETVEVVCGDIRQTEALPEGGADLVTVNPPYLTQNAGLDPQKSRTARQEETCLLGDVMGAACRLLKDGGRLCVVLRADRTAELFAEMRAFGLEPKRAVFVQPTEEKPPYLVLCEAIRNGKSGINIEKALVLNGPDGQMTQAYKDIYGFLLKEKTI